MKIEKLISIFEKLIPIYEKAINNEYQYFRLRAFTSSNFGICLSAQNILHKDIFYIMRKHYKHYLASSGYLNMSSYIKKLDNKDKFTPLRFRIDFMKKEIIRLNKLISEGYTHL